MTVFRKKRDRREGRDTIRKNGVNSYFLQNKI